MSVWRKALICLVCAGVFWGNGSSAEAGDFYRQILKERSSSRNANNQWQQPRERQGGYGRSYSYGGFSGGSAQRGWSAPFYGSQSRRSNGAMGDYRAQRQPDYMENLQKHYDKIVQKNSESFLGAVRRSNSGFR